MDYTLDYSSFLTRRKNIYYLQVRPPAANPIRVSLRTDSLRIAHTIIGDLTTLIYRFRAGDVCSIELKQTARVIAKQHVVGVIPHKIFRNTLSCPEVVISKSESVISSDVMSFSGLYSSFIEAKTTRAKNKLSQRMQSEYSRFFDYIIHIHPDFSDLSIDKITRKWLRLIILSYGNMPKRNKLPYSKMSWAELIVCIDGNVAPHNDLQSDSSINGLKKFIQGVFKHAVDQGFLDKSPANVLSLDLNIESPRGYYRVHEAQLMESGFLSLKKHVERKWIGLIALYHGARSGEITQLRKCDVRLDVESARYYLVITESAGSTKSTNSNRNIPVHKRLIELGFLGFVNESASGLLFPSSSGKKMTDWLYRLQKKVGVDRYDEHGMKRDFHSFRHTVVTMLRRCPELNESAIQQIVGHRVTSRGVTDVYTHGFEVKDLVLVLDQLSY